MSTPLRIALQLEEQNIEPFKLRLCPENKMVGMVFTDWRIGDHKRIARILDLSTKEEVFQLPQDEYNRLLDWFPADVGWLCDGHVVTAFQPVLGFEFTLLKQEASGEWARTNVPGTYEKNMYYAANKQEIFLLREEWRRVNISSLDRRDGSLHQKFSLDFTDHGDEIMGVFDAYVCGDKSVLTVLRKYQKEGIFLHVYDMETKERTCEIQLSSYDKVEQVTCCSTAFFAFNYSEDKFTTLDVADGTIIRTDSSFRLPYGAENEILAATRENLLVHSKYLYHHNLRVFDRKTGKCRRSFYTDRRPRATVSSDQKEVYVLNHEGALQVYCLEEPHV